MIVVYRKGMWWYVEALKLQSYNWWFGNYAWSGCWPSECCWIVPGTMQPDEYMVREYSTEMGR